jgi:hypothetical protein
MVGSMALIRSSTSAVPPVDRDLYTGKVLYSNHDQQLLLSRVRSLRRIQDGVPALIEPAFTLQELVGDSDKGEWVGEVNQ